MNNIGGGINIIDLNSPTNAYGEYTWASSDDEGYTVTADDGG